MIPTLTPEQHLSVARENCVHVPKESGPCSECLIKMIEVVQTTARSDGFKTAMESAKERVDARIRECNLHPVNWAPGDPLLADELRGILHWCDVNLRLGEEKTDPNLQVP